jgi:hypothetical protein
LPASPGRSKQKRLVKGKIKKMKAMQKRKLGNSGLEVSALGLGCMGMSWSYGVPKNKQEMFGVATFDWRKKDSNSKLRSNSDSNNASG